MLLFSLLKKTVCKNKKLTHCKIIKYYLIMVNLDLKVSVLLRTDIK